MILQKSFWFAAQSVQFSFFLVFSQSQEGVSKMAKNILILLTY